jgi:hypothetical protein
VGTTNYSFGCGFDHASLAFVFRKSWSTWLLCKLTTSSFEDSWSDHNLPFYNVFLPVF